MIAVDTNILVHAHQRFSPWHHPASDTLRRLAASPERWAIPAPCLHEFIAVTSNPRVSQRASPLSDAIRQVDSWLEAPGITLLSEGPSHWAVLRQLLEEGNVVGGMVHDARIAALCIDHGVTELWTADRDFQHFPSLKTHNPLGEARN